MSNLPPLGDLVVRLAEPTDFEAVGSLTLDAYLAAGMVSPSDPYCMTLADAADRAAKAELFLVDGPSGPLATVTLAHAGQPYAEFAVPGELEFRMLAVSPFAQGQGLGSRLVTFCRDQATARGDRGLVLSARDLNVAAIRLYERLGFVRQPARDQEPVPGVLLLALTLQW